jgi:hypothetical protein
MSSAVAARAVAAWREAVLSKDDGGLSSTDRLVALALSMHMDGDTLANAYPGPALLARRTGLAQSTVKASLARLVDLGWIEQTMRGGTDKGSSARLASVYRGIPRPTADPVREKDGLTRTTDRRDPSRTRPTTRPADGHQLVPHLDMHRAPCLECSGRDGRHNLVLDDHGAPTRCTLMQRAG